MCFNVPYRKQTKDNTNTALKQNQDAVLKCTKVTRMQSFANGTIKIQTPPLPPNIQTFRERYHSVLGENVL